MYATQIVITRVRGVVVVLGMDDGPACLIIIIPPRENRCTISKYGSAGL